MDIYKVELKDMRADSCRYEYELDDAFFEAIEAPEIRKGRLHVQLDVKKGISVYHLSFHTEGVVTVPCDRCLEDMEIDVDTDNRLDVKLGADYLDEETCITVPEEEGYIDVAWFLYEFIELSLPIKHVHAPGECNPQMMGALNAHLSHMADDDDFEEAEAGGEVEDGSSTEQEDGQPTDPRWDALKSILNNNK